jgi:hypothetical protein
MLSAITALFNALAAWFNYKAVTAAHDRKEQELQLHDEITSKIETLRASTDANDQLVADRLRQQLLRSDILVQHLSTAYPEFKSGTSGADVERDLYSDNG